MPSIKTSEKQKEKRMSPFLAIIPHSISFPLTIISCIHALNSNCLIDYFKLSVALNVNFEYKVSLLAKLSAWVALVLIFNVLSVIGARVISKAPNPLKDQQNETVLIFNRILSNTVEQSLVFLPLLANWIINSSNNAADIKQGITLAIIWIAGRVLFSITYFLGFLVDFSVLRVFGFVPTLLPSVILALRFFGFNVL